MKPVTAFLQFINLLCAGLIAGTNLITQVSLNRIAQDYPAREYTAFHKAMLRTFLPYVPMVSVPTPLSAAALLLFRQNRRSRLVLAAGLVFSLTEIIITGRGNVPINNEVRTWSDKKPPADWAEKRDKWQSLHALRTAANVAAFGLYIAASLTESRRAGKDAA